MTSLDTTTTPEAASVTGRDGYIAAKALVYAVACIQSLPENQREYSDMADMCDILHMFNLPKSLLDMVVLSVEHHVQFDVDLHPFEGMDDERQAMRDRINAMKAAHAEAIRRFNEGEGEAA